MYINTMFKDNFPKTPLPISGKFYRKHVYEGGINLFICNSGHMTKMSSVSIYGENPSKPSPELLNLLQ